MAENPAILLLHDVYNTIKDGASCIYRQLVDILREHVPGIPVFYTALEATEEDEHDAKSSNVKLLLPKLESGDSRTEPTLDWLTFDHCVKFPHLPQNIRSIVGHADVTSRATVRIKKERYPDTRVILFTSDIPEDTEYYKGDEEAMGIGKKEDSILEDAQEADVVFSLGNKIFDHFENQFRAIPASKRPQHVKFVPRPSKIFEDAEAEYKATETMVVLSIGRVKGAEKLKGYDLTAEFLSIVADKMKIRWRAMGVNKDDFEATKEILEHYKSANLQITLLPYGTQKDICKEMMQAHLVLMPSRAEPFGLVGLEAIAAGVPVLVSSNSGLSDFIHEHVDELHHSIVDMKESEEGATVKRWADAIERVLKHNRAEFKTAARGKQQLLSTKYWEESHLQFLKACTDAGSNMEAPPPVSSRDKGPPQGYDDKISESSETGTDMEEAPDQEGMLLYEMTPRPSGGPPLLPVVVEILEQVLPNVETPDDMLNYASALETLSTITVDKDLPIATTMLKQIKSRTSSITDLLTVVKAVKKLERFKGIKVSCVKTGSLVFYLQCTDVGGLGELWFMYQSGELDNLLHSSLTSEETLQQLHAESVSVKSTIKIETFRKALVYILDSSPVRGQLMPRLSLEYPLYQPHTHTSSRVLDALHLDQKKLPQIPQPSQKEDGEDDLLDKLGNLQIAARTSEETPEDTEVQEIIKPVGASVTPGQRTTDDQQKTIGDTEVPQMMSELVSLDILELERLMGPRRKRTSSIGSDSSGYVTGTPGSGLSRPDSPTATGKGDIQHTVETLLAEINKPEVQSDKATQFDLYCQIGDLYRTKLRNFTSALQYYQNMLECSHALSEETKQAKAYSRLGLTYDMLGLQDEAFTNHEKALAIYKVETDNETDICVAYVNLASSLALSGYVSDAQTNYESALAVAMETGNKTEQMVIYGLLGELHMVQLHEPQESLKYYTDMLALARDLCRKDMEGVAYHKLGLACNEMHDNEAALEWHHKRLEMSQEGGHKTVQTISHVNVGNTYRFLGKLDQATSHLNTALQMAQQTGDQHAEMQVYFSMGDTHRELHSPHTAIQYYEQHLALARKLKDRHWEGVAYNRLGRVHFEMEEYEAALECLLKFLQISRGDGNKKEQIQAHIDVGHVYWLLGKLDQSTSHFNTALQLAQQTGDQHMQMKVYFKMGEQPHSPRTAIEDYKQALALAKSLKDRHMAKVAYKRIGQIHFKMGEYGPALDWCKKYLQIIEEDGNKEEQITAHTDVGHVYRFLGKVDQATSHFNIALQLAEQKGDQHGRVKVYFEMGELHREQLHSPRTAIKYFDQALALARQLKDRYQEGMAYDRLEVVHFEMREYETSLECLKKYLKIKQESGEKKEQIAAHIRMGNVYSLQGNLDQATSHFNTALQLAQQTEIQYGQMEVYFQMGEMHREQLHSPHTAIQYYEQALALAKQLKDRDKEELAYKRLEMAHYDMGEHEATLEFFKKALKIQGDKGTQGKTHTNVDRASELQYPERSVTSQNAEDQRIHNMKISFYIGEMQREQAHSPRTAIHYYKQHLALARQLKDRHEEGLAYDRLGRAHFELEEYEIALDLYQRLLKMRKEDRDKKAQITAHKNIAKSYKKLGKKGQAKSQYQSAITIAMETGDKQQQDDIRKKIAKL